MYSPFFTHQGPFLFEGKTNEGIEIKGEIDTQNISSATEIIAHILWMQTGDFQIPDNIIKVTSQLTGVYFPHTIGFEYEDLSILFEKPIFSIQDAKRANKAIGAILEGNQVIITGEKMNLTKVESILKNICWLLRPICSGEVYFGHYVCNDTFLIFPEKDSNFKGTMFGFYTYVLESTELWKELLSKGLNTYVHLSQDKRQEYVNIAFALSVSGGCGNIETGMSGLTQTLEYIGQNTFEENSFQNDPKLNNEIKDIKNELVSFFESCMSNEKYDLSEIIQEGIKNSIKRIQPWNPQVIRKIESLLNFYHFNIKFNFEEFKETRDELAHKGMFPKAISFSRRRELQNQYEIILFVIAMDILGVEAKIKISGKDGWVNYVDDIEYKG
ncbi:MAG: hypothetical protein IPL20_06645 [Saprospiraceae bacterium]|nr:hypothetical protein [Saprospiraceae bacterium]